MCIQCICITRLNYDTVIMSRAVKSPTVSPTVSLYIAHIYMTYIHDLYRLDVVIAIAIYIYIYFFFFGQWLVNNQSQLSHLLAKTY